MEHCLTTAGAYGSSTQPKIEPTIYISTTAFAARTKRTLYNGKSGGAFWLFAWGWFVSQSFFSSSATLLGAFLMGEMIWTNSHGDRQALPTTHVGWGFWKHSKISLALPPLNSTGILALTCESRVKLMLGTLENQSHNICFFYSASSSRSQRDIGGLHSRSGEIECRRRLWRDVEGVKDPHGSSGSTS